MNPEFHTSQPGQTFPRHRRLTQASQFRRVFADASRAGGRGFVVLYRVNGSAKARLGLAISKKCARRAVDRNRLKRLVRESFRTNCHSLPGVDVVVLCSRDALAQSNRWLFSKLDRAWTIIRGKQKCVESSSA